MKDFLHALKVQRWDDHRYYHHSRINQSLHFVSAISFLTAYVMLFTNPVAAGLVEHPEKWRYSSAGDPIDPGPAMDALMGKVE